MEKMTLKWERAEIEKLIQLIQQNACIYSVQSPEYVNRIKKAEAFNNILSKMQETTPALTSKEIKSKWKNLRIQFMAAKRRMVSSKKSGAGLNDLYKPKLWCFDQLSFLNGHTEVKKSKCNIETSEEENDFSSKGCSEYFEDTVCMQSVTDESSSYTVEVPENGGEKLRKKKKSHQTHALTKDIAVLKGLAEKRANDKKKYAWLGSLVANQMDDVDAEDQPVVCWEVQCLLNKYVQKSQEKKKLKQRTETFADLSPSLMSPTQLVKEPAEENLEMEMIIEMLSDEEESIAECF